MEAINAIIIIFVAINIIVNIFWDGIIAFNHFDWIKKLCGNWDDIKKHFVINQCERWISCVNFCLMTILGLVFIYSMTLDKVPMKGDSGIGIKAVDNFIDDGEKFSMDPRWIYTIGICYVLARLILVSATLLTTNLNEKWLSVLPCVSLQIFILGLIMTTFAYKSLDNDNNVSILCFVIGIILTIVAPFIILRLRPTTESETDVSFKFGLMKSS